MRNLLGCAIAILLSGLLATDAEAAPRRRAVTSNMPFSIGGEIPLGGRRLVAGATGLPLAVASNGKETAVAWLSANYEQAFVGLHSDESQDPSFGALIPGASAAVQVATNGRTFLVAWLESGRIRVGHLTSDGLIPTATISLPTDSWYAIRLASDGERYLVAVTSSGMNTGNGRFTGQLLDNGGVPIGRTFELIDANPCFESASIAGHRGAFVAAISLCGAEARAVAQRIEANGDVGELTEIGAGNLREIVWSERDLYALLYSGGNMRIVRLAEDLRIAEEWPAPFVSRLLVVNGRPFALFKGDQGMVPAGYLDNVSRLPSAELLLPAGADQSVAEGSAQGIVIVSARKLCRSCASALMLGRWSPELEHEGESALFQRFEEMSTPAVAAYRDGFVVAWVQEQPDVGVYVRYARSEAGRWSAAVSAGGTGRNQRDPSVAAADDAFAVAFEEQSDDYRESSVAAVIVKNDGTAQRVEFGEDMTFDSIASNGLSFLLLYRRILAPELRARMMTVDGTLGPEQTIAVGHAGLATARWDGREYIVAYDVAEPWAARAGDQHSLRIAHLSADGAPAGETVTVGQGLLTFASYVPALAVVDGSVQMVYPSSPSLAFTDEPWRGILRRRVTPSVTVPDALASSGDYPTAASMVNLLLAAWIQPYSSIVVTLAGASAQASSTVSIPAYVPYGRSVAVASRGDEALLVYVRRMVDEGFGRSAQLMMREIRLTPAP